MKTHPMLFSAPMVQALLSGCKTQTRRILKPQPPLWATYCQQPTMLNALGEWVPSGLWAWSEPEQTPPRPLERWPVDAKGKHYWLGIKQAIGDLIWVRERIAIVPSSAYRQSEGVQQTINPSASYEAAIYGCGWDRSIPKWKPSIHMPRWASRLTLKVTGVRVERLQDISGIEACAEGVTWLDEGRGAEKWGVHGAIDYNHDTPCEAYSSLWNQINGADAWDENPFVVALTFEVIHKNIDQYLREAA